MCERLGYPHPDYLLSQLTWQQLEEWMEFTRQKNEGFKEQPTRPIDVKASLKLLDRLKKAAQANGKD